MSSLSSRLPPYCNHLSTTYISESHLYIFSSFETAAQRQPVNNDLSIVVSFCTDLNVQDSLAIISMNYSKYGDTIHYTILKYRRSWLFAVLVFAILTICKTENRENLQIRRECLSNLDEFRLYCWFWYLRVRISPKQIARETCTQNRK